MNSNNTPNNQGTNPTDLQDANTAPPNQPMPVVFFPTDHFLFYLVAFIQLLFLLPVDQQLANSAQPDPLLADIQKKLFQGDFLGVVNQLPRLFRHGVFLPINLLPSPLLLALQATPPAMIPGPPGLPTPNGNGELLEGNLLLGANTDVTGTRAPKRKGNENETKSDAKRMRSMEESYEVPVEASSPETARAPTMSASEAFSPLQSVAATIRALQNLVDMPNELLKSVDTNTQHGQFDFSPLVPLVEAFKASPETWKIFTLLLQVLEATDAMTSHNFFTEFIQHVRNMGTDLKDAREEIALLKSTATSTQEGAAAHLKLVQSATQEVERMRNKLSAAQASVTNANSSRDQALEQVRSLQEKLDAANQKIKALEEEKKLRDRTVQEFQGDEISRADLMAIRHFFGEEFDFDERLTRAIFSEEPDDREAGPSGLPRYRNGRLVTPDFEDHNNDYLMEEDNGAVQRLNGEDGVDQEFGGTLNFDEYVMDDHLVADLGVEDGADEDQGDGDQEVADQEDEAQGDGSQEDADQEDEDQEEEDQEAGDDIAAPAPPLHVFFYWRKKNRAVEVTKVKEAMAYYKKPGQYNNKKPNRRDEKTVANKFSFLKAACELHFRQLRRYEREGVIPNNEEYTYSVELELTRRVEELGQVASWELMDMVARVIEDMEIPDSFTYNNTQLSKWKADHPELWY